MSKSQVNLQDLFLNQVRKEGAGVTIYLTSGVQLKGLVRGFDSFTVVLETPGKPPQLIYKHAIASVVPQKSISLREMAAEKEQAAKTGEESGEPAVSQEEESTEELVAASEE
jgi:host factor-I protein